MEVARQWRRQGANRLRAFSVPEQVADLWCFGFITQAQALSPTFWESELCAQLITTMQVDLIGEAQVIVHTFTRLVNE